MNGHIPAWHTMNAATKRLLIIDTDPGVGDNTCQTHIEIVVQHWTDRGRFLADLAFTHYLSVVTLLGRCWLLHILHINTIYGTLTYPSASPRQTCTLTACSATRR